MANCLDVVAVGIAYEGAEVVRVVLRPHPGLVQHLCARGHRRIEEGLHGGTIGCREREVGLTEPLPGRSWPDPELRFGRGSEADHLSDCLLYTSPSPRDRTRSRMPSSA